MATIVYQIACTRNLFLKRRRAEEVDGPRDPVDKRNLRRPTQHRRRAADVQARPPKIAQPRRMELRLVRCAHCRGDRRMQLTRGGFDAGARVEALATARLAAGADERLDGVV